MLTAEDAFREAVEQMPLVAAGRDSWSSRAVYWSAVRLGADALRADAWPAVAEHWRAMWAIAAREHLPPIPGARDVGASPSVAAAEQGLARMRAIVGERGKHVHR
ncbi:hypothetical protein [Cupriavidus plantarum]|uniref:hypothetical protein n=1 Tax=Cupriavidus plantarum TaxID=942865 RepID=UPI000F2A8670|nr:hypothetical protein [Cupriavidus plantarum]RLK45961.1 hypothetical protein C7417_1992 [Cupriavidus plantarum]